MPLLIVIVIIANGFLCVLLTMRECKIETAPLSLVIKAFGMGLIWCAALALCAEILNALTKAS